MATWFLQNHQNEGWVNFGGVGERDEFWFLGKISGCGLCKQLMMGVAIFNCSTVNIVMGIGLVKITPNYIFGRRRGRRIRLRMRRRCVINLGLIWQLSNVRRHLSFYGEDP